MASSESNTFEESTSATTRENMPTENTATQIKDVLEMETEKEVSNTVHLNPTADTQRSAAYRGLHLTETDNAEGQNAEDSWWSEVENNDLLLDQVPNVTAIFTPTPEAILEKSISLAESESVLKEENFDRLHKIADKIKMTLSEHAKNKEIADQTERERKLSETSQKEQKTVYYQTDDISSNCYNNSNSNSDSFPGHKEQSLEEFKEELRSKRLQRQNAVQDLRDEIATLRRQLALEREVNKRLRCGEHVEESSLTTALDSSISSEVACAINLTDDEDPSSRSRHANIELANAQLALQMANSENISLRAELAVVQKQVVTLKEVIACCKQMLAVKEEQCNELKQRLTEIEKSFAEHETKIMSDNLRQEYERQLGNIRQLRQLYEERQRVAAAEYENLQRLISIKRDELAQEKEKSKSLEERNQNLMKEMEEINNELACLRDECKEHKFEKAALKEEIGAVNTLFSQMVMGFNGKNNLDIDRLTTMLEENRTLLNDMATKECTDGATLPKLLFELVEQATTTEQDSNKEITTPSQTGRGSSFSNKAGTSEFYVEQNVKEMEENTEDSVNEYGSDSENMASLTSNVQQLQQNEMLLAKADSTSCHNNNTSPILSATLAQGHGNDVVDVATNNNDGKVAVAMQNKSKKHNRKLTTNNKKSATSSSMSASHSSSVGGAVTLQQLHDPDVINKVTSAQEIVGNLPKVWRVLIELLSHHKIDPVQFEEDGKSEDCYKSIETPNGPKYELSVSKTYLKLKDLILEKKSLVKETNRLKTLNSHLDYRLNEQEKRLSAVSLELTKTWHLVGKMQRQHRQLHTQEQILRYQLQQKRRLLSELKDELEYCRRKWAAARAKNDESQEQCNDLRREFARRKLEDANNSAESGYSDSGGPASDEEIAVAVGDGEAVAVVQNMDDGDDEDEDFDEATSAAANTAAGGCLNYRRKRLREMFEHTRKIKRMQSTSPGRAGKEIQPEIVVLRWNSAPPTCGWRDPVVMDDDDNDEVDGKANKESASKSSKPPDKGAVPKAPVRPSRRVKRCITGNPEDDIEKEDSENLKTPSSSDDRACRIQRLEQQCKTLIKQVLETSDNRERLEVQLRRFQDEISPAQHAIPLEELINKKRFERMTRASSLPLTNSGCLTAREEEYTRKRSERLERLEEESRQLISRIKRTSDRGYYLRCSLDRIRRGPISREGSIESVTEDDLHKLTEESENSSINEIKPENILQPECRNTLPGSNKVSLLTAEEEAYTARRAARLQRLEEESKELLRNLSKNNQRGDNIGNRLDILHERYTSQEEASSGSSQTPISSAKAGLGSGKMSVEQRIENIEKISSNREERLRILEEEGRQLINKLSETSERGTKMINRIAERELNRQKTSSTTTNGDKALENDTSRPTKSMKNTSSSEETPVAAALLPTPKNVACSSIVSEELNDRVTITTIPSQIAANRGAIPKTKPSLELLASRPKSARLQKPKSESTDNEHESLEEMVKRLQSLPFPGSKPLRESGESKESNLEITNNNDTTGSSEAFVVEPQASDDTKTCNSSAKEEQI